MPDARASAIAAGLGNTCVITPAGTVDCWGSHLSGESGIRTEPNQALPDSVDGLPAPVSHVSISSAFTCAIAGAGVAYCWGDNTNGTLGDRTNDSRPLPQPVLGLTSPVTDLSAGYTHACAIVSGVVWCWGVNERGQLGDGTNAPRLEAGAVSLPEQAINVSAGFRFSCALGASGAAYCWGDNTYGQLGVPGPNPSATPIAVSGGHAFAQVTTGLYHACARTSAGAAFCWGLGGQGQLGRGFYGDSSTPVPVLGLSGGVASVVGGGFYSCALLTEGSVRCWGSNFEGSLGDGSRTERIAPTAVVGLGTAIAEIDANNSHTCALSLTGDVQCWGRNSSKQLGEGPPDFRALPVDVATLPAVTFVEASDSHTCAIAGGLAYCWGDNFNGMLGDGTDLFRLRPEPVVGLGAGVSMLALGRVHTCALRGGAVSCWGDGNSGQLGNGGFADASTPQQVTGLASGVASITATGFHACARTTGGAALCWGGNDHGQLGDGTETPRGTPVPVSGLASGVTALASGGGTSSIGDHTCALVAGGVKCWGSNVVGQLGDATTTNRATPVDVVGLSSGVAAIGAGEGVTCAVLLDGAVRCWGDNQQGQLGTGVTSVFEASPVPMLGLGEPAVEALPGEGYVCVRTASQRLRCVGSGSFGRFGTGDEAQYLAPVDVLRTSEGVVGSASGRWFGCAIVTGGALRCFGYNFDGQLGNGESGFFAKPIASRTLIDASAAPQILAGGAVVATGDLVVAGAPGDGATSDGRVLIYERGADGEFLPPAFDAKRRAPPTRATATLTWSGAKAGRVIGDKFGAAVAVSADGATIAVGAPGSGTGRVLIYERPGMRWTDLGIPDQTLEASPEAGTLPQGFGSSLAFSSDGTLIVGAPSASVGAAAGAGAAYRYTRDESGLSQASLLLATTPSPGAAFGSAVGVDADTIAVGAPNEADDTGAVYTFPTTAPAVPARVAAPGGAIGDKFGTSVLVRGGAVVVGAPGTDDGVDPDVGAAHVIRRGRALTGDDVIRPVEPETRGFGAALGESAGTLVIGAPLANVSGRPGQGRAILYDLPDGEIVATAARRMRVIGSASNRGSDAFGSSVAVSSSGIVVGVPFHDQLDAAGSMSGDVGRLDLYPGDRIHRGGFER